MSEEDFYIKQNECYGHSLSNLPEERSSPVGPSGVKRAMSFIVVIGTVLFCAACIVCFAFAFVEISKLKSAQLNGGVQQVTSDQGSMNLAHAKTYS